MIFAQLQAVQRAQQDLATNAVGAAVASLSKLFELPSQVAKATLARSESLTRKLLDPNALPQALGQSTETLRVQQAELLGQAQSVQSLIADLGAQVQASAMKVFEEFGKLGQASFEAASHHLTHGASRGKAGARAQ